MRWYLAKIQSWTFALINNFEILQVSIAFFSNSVWPRNLKFFLYINPYGYSMQTKFHVPQSHSFWEKCDDNLQKFKVAHSPKYTTLKFYKLSSHFSRKLCDRGTWNLVCIEYPYGLIYKINFKLLGHTVSEKNSMLTCKISKLFIRSIVQLWIFTRYHRIFLENCVSEEHEIWLA